MKLLLITLGLVTLAFATAAEGAAEGAAEAICDGGCGPGLCYAPNECYCPAQYKGTNCEIKEAVTSDCVDSDGNDRDNYVSQMCSLCGNMTGLPTTRNDCCQQNATGKIYQYCSELTAPVRKIGLMDSFNLFKWLRKIRGENKLQNQKYSAAEEEEVTFDCVDSDGNALDEDWTAMCRACGNITGSTRMKNHCCSDDKTSSINQFCTLLTEEYKSRPEAIIN